MALLENVIFHGTIFAVVLTVYLLVIMKGLNPRVWAMSDYPTEIAGMVEPQTDAERKIAVYTGIPFILISFGFPIISTLILEASFGGTISITDAFLNLFGLMMFGQFGDLFILDLLIVGTITPNWVIIPGTEHLKDTAYKDFRIHHAKAHVRGTIIMVLLSLIIGLVIALI